MSDSKIRVLHILYGIEGGGVGVLAYNYSIRLMDVCQFDFVAFAGIDGCLSANLKQRGCNIFLLPTLSRGCFKKHMQALSSIIKQGKYDVIYAHTNDRAYFSLKVAKKLGVKVRIAHAHTSYVPENTKATIIRKICTFLTKRKATQLVACGETAAKWMWGNHLYKNGRIKIINNAINVEKFRFSIDVRKHCRKKLGITDDECAFVCVARLSIEKNHQFLIDVWDKLPRNTSKKLFFIGDGKEADELKALVKRKKLEKNIFFLGLRDDINELLNAFDCFLLPSLYEGVPVSIIEAQANGLPCLLSSNIPKDVQRTNLVKSIELNVEKWIEELDAIENINNRSVYANIVADSGYDITRESEKIKRYIKHME